MNTAASTTAWALHDLSLATSLGGSIYGKLALHPSVHTISDRRERGRVLHAAWKKYNRLNLLGHLVFASTWLVGRTMLTGREVDRTSRLLVGVKDGLIATSLVSGVTSIVAGERGIREPDQDAPPMNDLGMPDKDASTRAKTADVVTTVAGAVNTAAVAGIIAVTAVLAMRAGKSSKWKLISRFLP